VKELDAVSLGIMWDRLIAITNEALSALVRTSFSTNVREAYDLSVMLFDARGRSIAQADFSMPSFTGTGPFTVGHVLDRFPPETLRPGDVLATNDPWLGTGHVYDINVLRPIFRDDRLLDDRAGDL
jgi:N-methylhydantoinase B